MTDPVAKAFSGFPWATMSSTGERPDPRIAALAEALVEIDVKSIDDWWTWEPTKLAAAILAALPPDWCGHKTAVMLEQEAEAHEATIARLRTALAAHHIGFAYCDLCRPPEPKP
jgi:hypothetical protein